jgi:hypothetical protein
MASVDNLLAALVGGLLGGGVTGALIAGWITLQSQRRSFEHERRGRFLDLRRQRYAALLRATDEWVRAQWGQLEIAEGMRRDGDPADIPPLLPTRPLQLLADEIELLAPNEVGDAAGLLVFAIGILEGFDEADPAQARAMREMAPYREASAEYTLRRNLFVKAAKADLGTD